MVTKQYKGTDQTATGTSRSSTKRLTKPPQEHGHEAVQREERHESIVRCLQQHDALAHASVAHCDGAVHEWHVPKGVRHTRTHIHTHARTRTQRSVRFDLFLGEKGNTSHASTPRGHGGVSRIAWQGCAGVRGRRGGTCTYEKESSRRSPGMPVSTPTPARIGVLTNLDDADARAPQPTTAQLTIE